MQATAIRHIDPAELPALVTEAVTVADDAALDAADRAVLLPVILELLGRRSVMPQMPVLAATDAAAILGRFGR